jgi:sulfonate transport system substrate-binding protein
MYADGTRTGRLLADGVIDFGGTGSTPPLTAQALRLPIAYAAASAPRPGHGALLAAEGGFVTSPADLKGRPVALAVGSWQTHFVAKLLAAAGLSYQDIEPRPAGPEAGEWLRSGEVAAWVAQGADLVDAERSGETVTLSGTAGVVPDRSVFFTRRDFAEDSPHTVASIVRALHEADDWARLNPRAAAVLTAEAAGGSADSWEIALRRLPWRLEPISAGFLAEQQEAADTLADAGFLPDRIDVSAASVAALDGAVAAVLDAPTALSAH